MMNLRLGVNQSVFFLLLTVTSNCILAQSDMRSSIVRTEDRPKINGVLDDEVWAQATVVTEFHQIEPVEYGEPSERTEVRLLYDKDAIYIGARMYDSDPGSISAQALRNGSSLRAEDRLKVLLDPYNDKRSGYEFEANAHGVRGGGLYKGERVDRNWDGIWEAASRITDFGWVTEYRIPFKTLSFDGEGDWGFNLTRKIPRKNETISWSSRNREFSPAYSGTLSGLENLSQGIGLDIVPSISVVGHRDYALDKDDNDVEPSLDVYYKLTPSINGSVTFNTDFSATEVDNRQVDLSRFSLFFPEKRDFFLRESDIFEFGGIGGLNMSQTVSRPDRENARPYFSRRIGLNAAGAPVSLEMGAKVTGRYGRYNFGLMSLRQEEDVTADGVVDASTLTVARVSANILDESNIGFIGTMGDPNTNVDNTLLGFDFRYRNTRLPQGRSVVADAWYQKTDTDGLNGDDAAFGVSLDMPNQTGLRGLISAREVQQNFNPALGFVSRANVRQYTGQIGYKYRLNGALLRSVFAGVDGQRVDVIGGDLQSENVLLRLLELETNAEDEFQLRINRKKENLVEDFEVSAGVIIPANEYSFVDTELLFKSAGQRKADVELRYLFGDFFNGDITTSSVTINWRPTYRYELGASYTIDDVDLPNGKFKNKLATAKANVAFSNRWSWVNLVQYDNVSDSIGINSRLQWTPKAGQNLFFVINHNYLERDDAVATGMTTNTRSYHSDSTDVTLKFNYTFRF